MGKKGKEQQKQAKEDGASRRKKQEELLKTLGDFTSKENWDQFFTIRGSGDSFEWYAEWTQLQTLLTDQLLYYSSARPESEEAEGTAAEVSILVPGCGNSKLSEHLYDSGFKNITNVDFSKVVISDMLRRNVRERPGMKWRVMDMTDMQFADETFDVIVDKGGLDALMEPELGPSLGTKYLSEVKRLSKTGGRYICLTLAQSHVLELLFHKFRFGWKISLYAISQGSSTGSPNLRTFMFVAERDTSTAVFEMSLILDDLSVKSHGNQASELYEALEKEKKIRAEYSNGSDILYSLEELNLGVKGDLEELEPCRRLKLRLGELGVSRFFYHGVLLDARLNFGPFSYKFGVFLVPKLRAHDWLFSSEEGQWAVVESSKAARLVMIFLDSSNSNATMEDIQMDLSPLVKQLAPGDCHEGVQIPFMAASDGVKQREIVHQVTSALTGPIVVEDVVYEKIDDDLSRHFPSKDLIFRRLTFKRTENLVQSEALLSIEEPNGTLDDMETMKTPSASKTRKKGRQKKNNPHKSGFHDLSSVKDVYHNYLASSYHNGIISGIMLISFLKGSTSASITGKMAIIGLGAGLLPMFLRNCLPNLDIEVVELDPVVFDIARDHFGFREDESLRAHIADGINFLKDKATDAETEEKGSGKINTLIIDVDSADSSSGLACPATEFVEESFLLTARDSLSEHGLFIINLVSRSQSVKNAVYSRLKKVFRNHLFHLQLEEDVNEVIFALKTEETSCLINKDEDQLSGAQKALAESLKMKKQQWSQRVIDTSKFFKLLKD